MVLNKRLSQVEQQQPAHMPVYTYSSRHKTQIATVMLAARYDAWFGVVAGTTLGMMLANAPVVWLGARVTQLVPLRVVHIVSALIFAGLGLAAVLIKA